MKRAAAFSAIVAVIATVAFLPHFFFLRRDGSLVRGMQGVLPADTLRRALDRLLAERPSGLTR